MLSAQRIERLRGSLLEERTRLRQQIANLTADSQEADVGLSNHMAEDATAAFDQATSISLCRGQQLTLEQVEQALERMETGSYGYCDRCREPIDYARLKALPQATLCLTCQKLAEF
jgi:DnaK suppressor protein